MFTQELERALLDGRIDYGVHSMKDLPYEMPQGLKLAGILPRGDCRDALVLPGEAAAFPQGTDGAVVLRALPARPVIGTSSTRRAAQVAALRSDAQIVEIRGNIQTRLARLTAGEYDALLLAAAGLERLALAAPFYPFEVQDIVPAPGQGIIALQSREADPDLHLEGTLPDRDCLYAERAFAREFGGGCTAPVGALARTLHGQLTLYGFASDAQGRFAKDSIAGRETQAEELGRMLAARIRKKLGES